MFKALLKTLPSLTGNFKLACKVNHIDSKYVEEGIEIYETNIQSASLQPLQNKLFNKDIIISLINDKYEYNVMNFYNKYLNTFYNDNYIFNKIDFKFYDEIKGEECLTRNKNYEFGCKRISYYNTGYQYEFFCPIYIDNYEDLPKYLDIEIKFNQYKIKKIRININNDNSKNYLYKYLNTYLRKIDEKIIFFNNETKQATYFGINVNTGGFVSIKDNNVKILYDDQLPINEFNKTINEGFKRNSLIIKQIIPLAFQFNIDDILTEQEKKIFEFIKIQNISATFVNNFDLPFYDINTNHDELFQYNYKYNSLSNTLIRYYDKTNNILNKSSKYSLKEKYLKEYRYDKLTPNYNHWVLGVNNEFNYYTNLNINYTLNGQYGEFPNINNLKQILLYNYQNNIELLKTSDSNDYETLKSNYLYNMNNHINSWYTLIDFETIDNIDNLLNKDNFVSCINNYAYYKGILYDLNNIVINKKISNIDYFGIFLSPKFNIIDDDNIIETINICVNKESENNNFSFNLQNNEFELKNIDSKNVNISTNVTIKKSSYDFENKTQYIPYTYDDKIYLNINEILNKIENLSSTSSTISILYALFNNLSYENKLINIYINGENSTIYLEDYKNKIFNEKIIDNAYSYILLDRIYSIRNIENLLKNNEVKNNLYYKYIYDTYKTLYSNNPIINIDDENLLFFVKTKFISKDDFIDILYSLQQNNVESLINLNEFKQYKFVYDIKSNHYFKEINKYNQDNYDVYFDYRFAEYSTFYNDTNLTEFEKIDNFSKDIKNHPEKIKYGLVQINSLSQFNFIKSFVKSEKNNLQNTILYEYLTGIKNLNAEFNINEYWYDNTHNQYYPEGSIYNDNKVIDNENLENIKYAYNSTLDQITTVNGFLPDNNEEYVPKNIEPKYKFSPNIPIYLYFSIPTNQYISYANNKEFNLKINDYFGYVLYDKLLERFNIIDNNNSNIYFNENALLNDYYKYIKLEQIEYYKDGLFKLNISKNDPAYLQELDGVYFNIYYNAPLYKIDEKICENILLKNKAYYLVYQNKNNYYIGNYSNLTINNQYIQNNFGFNIIATYKTTVPNLKIFRPSYGKYKAFNQLDKLNDNIKSGILNIYLPLYQNPYKENAEINRQKSIVSNKIYLKEIIDGQIYFNKYNINESRLLNNQFESTDNLIYIANDNNVYNRYNSISIDDILYELSKKIFNYLNSYNDKYCSYYNDFDLNSDKIKLKSNIINVLFFYLYIFGYNYNYIKENEYQKLHDDPRLNVTIDSYLKKYGATYQNIKEKIFDLLNKFNYIFETNIDFDDLINNEFFNQYNLNQLANTISYLGDLIIYDKKIGEYYSTEYNDYKNIFDNIFINILYGHKINDVRNFEYNKIKKVDIHETIGNKEYSTTLPIIINNLVRIIENNNNYKLMYNNDQTDTFGEIIDLDTNEPINFGTYDFGDNKDIEEFNNIFKNNYLLNLQIILKYLYNIDKNIIISLIKYYNIELYEMFDKGDLFKTYDGIESYNNINIYKDDKNKTYAFILYTPYIDNTINTFNFDNNILFNKIEDFKLTKKAFLYYFNNITPYLKNPLFNDFINTLGKYNIIIEPTKFIQNLRLQSEYISENENNKKESLDTYNMVQEYDNLNNTLVLYKNYGEYNVKRINSSKISIYRYTNFIKPAFIKSNELKTYNLKLKNTNKQFGIDNIYYETTNINKYNGCKIFEDVNKKVYNNDLIIYEHEFKHFNNNRYFILPEKIEIKLNKQLTYDELISCETQDYVIKIFEKYTNKYKKVNLSKNEILFLFNKYKIDFLSNPVSLMFNKENKLYELKYIFTIL